jgi:predicted RNase H-like nuclease (RuvC/YqgF family)
MRAEPGESKELRAMDERLNELRIELDKGERRLDGLDRERAELQRTMLRISGAIQVLEELTVAGDGHPAPIEQARAEPS